MADDTLPGLPQPPRQPDPQPDLTPLDNACADLSSAAVETVMQARAECPNLGPADIAAQVLGVVVEAMRPMMAAPQLRTGALAAFERSHAEPMSFVDIGRVKKALETIADARRREERVTTGGVIIPGKD